MNSELQRPRPLDASIFISVTDLTVLIGGGGRGGAGESFNRFYSIKFNSFSYFFLEILFLSLKNDCFGPWKT